MESGMDPLVTTRIGQCSFQSLHDALPTRVLKEHVHVIDQDTKALLFAPSTALTETQRSAALALQDRLRNLSLTASQNFDLKSDTVEDMTFRLLNQRGALNEIESSFIALSYCWQTTIQPCINTTMAPEVAPETASDYPLPISPLLFQALLAERQSITEGIWCDQICINQGDEDEKARAINAMAFVYKKARLIIIVLDDIEVDEAEQTFLRGLLDTYETSGGPRGRMPNINIPPDMKAHPIFARFLAKLLRAKWFT